MALQLVTIPAERILDVHGEVVPKLTTELALPPGLLDRMLTNCPGVLTIQDEAYADDNDGQPTKTTGLYPDHTRIPTNGLLPIGLSEDMVVVNPELTLTRLTTSHGRSFEINTDTTRPWQDEFGNWYSSFSTKGNDFSSPKVIDSTTAANGVIAYGLQESLVIQRVLCASRELRKANIGTEYIVGLTQPESLPWPSTMELLSQDQYKRRIVQQHWRRLPEEQRTLEALGDLQSKFNEMLFVVSVRAMDTSYRLTDLIASPVAFSEVLAVTNDTDIIKPDQSYEDNIAGRWQFLQTVTAPRFAKNLYRLHDKHLVHGFLHPGNVTALGSIVDLDSVRGEPLGMGDEPITDRDRLVDIYTSLNTLRRIQTPQHFEALLRRADETVLDLREVFLTEYFTNVAANRPDGVKEVGELLASLRGIDDNELRRIAEMSFANIVIEQADIASLSASLEVCFSELANNTNPVFERLLEAMPIIGRKLLDDLTNEFSMDADYTADRWLANYQAWSDPVATEFIRTTLASLSRVGILQSAKLGSYLQDAELYGSSIDTIVEKLIAQTNFTQQLQAFTQEQMPHIQQQLVEALRAATTPKRTPTVFEGADCQTNYMGTTAINTFLRGTEVTEADLLSFVGTRTSATQVSLMNLTDTNHYSLDLPNDGSKLVEVISDSLIEEIYSSSDQEITTKFKFGYPQGNFLLFVIRDADGDIQFKLQCRDEALYEALLQNYQPATRRSNDAYEQPVQEELF